MAIVELNVRWLVSEAELMCPCALNPSGLDGILLLFASPLPEVEVDNQVNPTECDATLPPLHEETLRRIKVV